MKMLNKSKIFFFATLIIFIFCFSFVEAGPYIAFSLDEARNRLNESGNISLDLIELGGITQPIGIVYDEDKRDIILIGRVNEGEQKITLDDLIVALRAIFKYKTPPLVSIDKTTETARTGKQKVRFEGGIENTRFGKDLLDADVVLKKLGLGKITAHIWGVQSYFELSARQWKDTGIEDSLTSRFWFRPSIDESYVGIRKGVAVVQKLKVDVKTEIMGAVAANNSDTNLSQMNDEVGDKFVMGLKANFADITASAYYPSLNRLEPLFRLAGLAEGLNRTMFRSSISLPNEDYWMHKYNVRKETTPNDYPLLVSEEILQRDGKKKRMTVDGGIELKALILDLNDGSITAFRDIVVKSRPDGNILLWSVPLDGWQGIETSELSKTDNDYISNSNDIRKKIGMSMTSHFSSVDESSLQSGALKYLETQISQSPLSSGLSSNFFSNLNKPPSFSPNAKIGGVMLSGVASVAGSGPAKVDLSGGNFSFIVDGKNARIAPEAFRKFVTALWTVYYSNQDPGISIDPIAPGVDKHLVRYIGKVVNTDLGRVMREADYLMKKWSVGTDRPDIRGFKNPDDYAAEERVLYLAASRFWFVPRDMKFKRGDDMLLFDDGRMTIQTEYLTDSAKKSADPANEKFADFFTRRYNDISEKYPVYKELFDYAKMVSLAKYLKEQGIPLFWFLMANKDLVLTEDSPGTVDELVKGSDYFRDITISGGVDLGFDTDDQSNYVYDQSAVDAINEARSKYSSHTESSTSMSYDRKTTRTGPDPFSFDLGKKSYTVVPQHSLTSGKDRKGIRYQTDMALRGRGLQLTQQSLDILKADLVYRETMTEMEPILKTMEKHNLDQDEIIALYEVKKRKAEKKVGGLLKGLDKIKNKKYSDKNEFITALNKSIGTEQTEKLKHRISKVSYYSTSLELVRYFNPKERSSGEFGNGWKLLVPYRIKPSGKTKIEFANYMVSKRMALINLLTGEEEILTFSPDRYSSAAYAPDELGNSQVIGLFMMTDASYQLKDKLGNEFWFNPQGYLTDMVFSKDHRISYEYLEGFTDAFEQGPYSVEPAGNDRVDFLNVSIPKRMELKDHVNVKSEILTFSDKGDMAGYVPEDVDKSRYKIMALMSDTSLRLIDRNGNEVALTPSGEFEKMAVSDKQPIVSAVSQGNHRIAFKYTIDNLGNITIASANLTEGKDQTPTVVVKYEYDEEGRLCTVTKTNNKLAEKPGTQDKIKLASK